MDRVALWGTEETCEVALRIASPHNCGARAFVSMTKGMQ